MKKTNMYTITLKAYTGNHVFAIRGPYKTQEETQEELEIEDKLKEMGTSFKEAQDLLSKFK